MIIFVDDKGICFSMAEEYRYRVAREDDFPAVWMLLHGSALIMVERGRRQWDEHYPTKTSIENDIVLCQGYVLVLDGEVVAYQAVSLTGEPAYDQLKGKWLSQGGYATVHRMAVSPSRRGRGLSKLLMSYAEQTTLAAGFNSLRIDTNYDNVEMLSLIGRCGFTECGTVQYEHNGVMVERIAFEKILAS